MKVYYPYKRFEFNDELYKYEESGEYVVTEFDISELWKRMLPSQFFKFLKKCYFSKKKAQQFCDWKNADVYFPELENEPIVYCTANKKIGTIKSVKKKPMGVA